MSLIAVKMKLMPSSPESNLEEIENKVKELLEEQDAKNPTFETQPIAFGLKALIASFGWPEDKELEGFEDQLRKIENVNSVEMIDMRRALG
ncbi:MAG: elongation factor 1-beta [Nanoarchaeota archaeon]|nr:elongation factor 1-beta [Nanoarchaeota archaeon]